VVTEQYKLVRFYGPEADYWELYDRRKDPLELRDCSADPANAEVVLQLKAELARLRTELKVPTETPPSAFGGKPLK
jgi:arylsulfatase A-like enzyme